MTTDRAPSSRLAPWARAAILAGALVIAALGTGFQTHSWPSTIMVLIPTMIILVLAARRPPAPMERAPRIRRGLLVWSIVLALALAWEAYAFVRQPDWSRADPANPTISTLLDPVLEQPGPLRLVGWLVWLWAGWRLVTR